MSNRPNPTGVERFLGDEEIIVSKTDPKGKITYVNKIFQTISGYTEDETLGRPHNFVRHPDMPRCIFRLLWETIQQGNEIFAYVVNLCSNGDHYWVLAHVTPTFSENKSIIGFHSNRRAPARQYLPKVISLYDQLVAEEKRHANIQDGIRASSNLLMQMIKKDFQSYDEFIHSIDGAVTC